jgi:hypothetical protein
MAVSSGNHQPLGNWNNIPIYLTTILTAVFAAGLVTTVVLMTMNSPALMWLPFGMPLVPPWSIWRLVSYVFIGQISFVTPFAILCFYWWSVGSRHIWAALFSKTLPSWCVAPAVCAVWWAPAFPGAAGNYALTGGSSPFATSTKCEFGLDSLNGSPLRASCGR